MDNQAQQNYYSSLQAVMNQALVQALSNNESQSKTWRDYKTAHEKVKKGLKVLPEELTTNCMVPIGRKALMKGKLVHTNEILVCLGAQYFAKYSAKQAIAVCDRRIKQADEMLSSLEKERDLLEMRRSMPTDYGVFGDNERQEIIETYVEEEELQWRIKHRQREKEYRQKLAELRAQEKTEIRSEEDLWQRLDELELQEELEDEIDRLQSDDCNYYGEDPQNDDHSYEDDDNDDDDSEFSEDETMIDRLQESLAKLKNIRESKQKTCSSQSETSYKESDNELSPTSDVNDNRQPSTSSNLNESMVKLKSIVEINDGVKTKCSLSSSKKENSANDKEVINANAKLTQQDFENSSIQSLQTSVNSGNTESTNLRDMRNVDSNKDFSQSEVQVRTSVKFESQSQENANKQLVISKTKEEGEFSREFNINERVTKSEASRRRVSFTDKIQVNVFDKSGNHSSDENGKQMGECSGDSNAKYETGKRNSFSKDKNTRNFTDQEDEEDIIKIEVKHSDVQPRTRVKSNKEDVIEDPSDIYRVFCKPKSILKKSSGDIGDHQNVVPSADDTFYQETEETPAGSTYNVIVKDVEERNPEVLQVNNLSNKGRPLSRFKMARTGMK